jgi:hypothetical protein
MIHALALRLLVPVDLSEAALHVLHKLRIIIHFTHVDERAKAVASDLVAHLWLT